MPTSDSAESGSRTDTRSHFQRATRAWVALSWRRPWTVLLVAALVTAAGVFVASSLRIDTDLKKLLPRSYPTVRQMDQAISKIGDLGYFSVVIESDDPDVGIRYAKGFAERIAASPFVRTVFYENPVDFLKKNRFLLTPLAELERVRDYILAKRREKSPFGLGLMDDSQGQEDSAADEPDTGAADDETLDQIKKAYRSIDKMKRFHTSEDGRIVAMQIRPRQAVTNLSFVRKMYDDLVAETRAFKEEGHFPADLRVDVSGSLKNKLDEYSLIMSDIKGSITRSGALILLVLLIFFRNPVSVALLLLSLGSGLAWAFATARLTIGYLNTISAMLFVVLFGLGIDHGIHLLHRYVEWRRGGKQDEEAMAATLLQTGRAVWISALTTTGGFMLMLFTDFKGFSHLGFIAGVAMLSVTFSYFAMLPALCVVADRRGILEKSFIPSVGARVWEWWAARVLAPSHRVGTVSLAVLCVAGLAAGTLLKFNYDFDTFKGTVAASEAVKKKQAKVYTESLTPGAVFFADNDQELDEIVDTLQSRKKAPDPTPTIGRIMSVRDFLPTDQEQRLEAIREAGRLVTPLVLKKTKDKELRRMLADLRRSTGLQPLSAVDVPPQLMSLFTPQDGSDSRVVFVFPSIERKQGLEAIAFADDMAPIPLGHREAIATGDTLVFAEVLRIVVEQGLLIFVASILAIALLIAWQMRRLMDILDILFALAAGLGLMAILLWALEVDINFYNMVIFAAVVGMGVDSAVHVVSRWREEEEEDLTRGGRSQPVLTRTVVGIAGPISACALTTMAGYLGMVFSHHPGLRSIGNLAVVGLASCWVVSLTFLLIRLRRREAPATPV